ncbi:MAG: LysR family transcriptional regulator [Deltaproteobacteria bacterium]|nr:LysR family transcriptional regulator [Nannocystaceae bacterium]
MSIQDLDLNLLVTLDAVLGERSVARAAKRLHVTPSAVSNALARLRIALGDPLLARSGRGIVPTPRALQLAPALARALAELDAIVHDGGFDPASSTRRFTLAIADAGQLTLVPRLVAALAHAMPRARLRVVAVETLLSSGGLAGSEVDVAIGRMQRGTGVHTELLYDERMVLVVRARHPRAGVRLGKAELGALAHVDVHVVAGRSSGQVNALYARAGLAREIAAVVPSFTAAAGVAARSLLAATIPQALLEVLGPTLGLRAVVGPIPAVSMPMHLGWHERTHLDPAMQAFRGLARGLAGPNRAGRKGAAGPRRSSRAA